MEVNAIEVTRSGGKSGHHGPALRRESVVQDHAPRSEDSGGSLAPRSEGSGKDHALRQEGSGEMWFLRDFAGILIRGGVGRGLG